MTLPSPTPRRTTTLPLLAFNDVYRVTQKYSAPAGHATRTNQGEPPSSSSGDQAGKGKKEDEYISVAQFGRTLLGIRDGWGDSSGGEGGKEGLVLFAGDGPDHERIKARCRLLRRYGRASGSGWISRALPAVWREVRSSSKRKATGKCEYGVF
ncbi:hypothetical protein QFC21_001576 [Naganishia friedmannii]|uniref:Uncharacterized protein n=1 Tax=Naganishia friedmannii TaxID=89922 RepID=A0ACC2W529_9TREE|nr:hypothetical protein QFC21_001576 [Naganishia friedmannii]